MKMKVTTKQLKKLVRKTVSDSLLESGISRRKREQLEEVIVEGFFSKLGNKAAAAVGMRGKEKEQISVLDTAKKAWDQVKGLWDVSAFIKDMQRTGKGNVMAQPGWLVSVQNNVMDKGWLPKLQALMLQLVGRDAPEMETLENFERYAKGFAQAEQGATVRDPRTQQPTGVQITNPQYVDTVLDLSNKLAKIVSELDNKYNAKVGELKKRLGQA